MKSKLLLFILVFMLILSAFAEGNVNIAALKGPTAIGMIQMIENAKTDDSARTFTIYGSADEIVPGLIKGEIDIAAVPANLASVLYNKTEGNIRVLGVNTLGVLYIIENGESIQSLEDLRGRTLYASGRGATPEYALNYILKENGIDPETDLCIEWKSEHNECLASMLAEENGIALLPQPFVTTAIMKNEGIRTAIDLNEEWAKLENGSSLITGVVIARAAFCDGNSEFIDLFLDDYATSVEFVNADPAAASVLIEASDIIPAAVASKAIPFCNIVLIEGQDMKDYLSGYLSVLLDADSSSVGGSLPGDDFYYSR